LQFDVDKLFLIETSKANKEEWSKEIQEFKKKKRNIEFDIIPLDKSSDNRIYKILEPYHQLEISNISTYRRS
jgi:hypothetical protein